MASNNSSLQASLLPPSSQQLSDAKQMHSTASTRERNEISPSVEDECEDDEDERSNPYKAFDEIRRLAHYSLAILQSAIIRYEKFVNTRLSPAFYALDEEEFRLVFKLKPSYAPKINKRHEKIVNDVFSRFAREDGRVDLLELFGGLAILCDAAKGDE